MATFKALFTDSTSASDIGWQGGLRLDPRETHGSQPDGEDPGEGAWELRAVTALPRVVPSPRGQDVGTDGKIQGWM